MKGLSDRTTLSNQATWYLTTTNILEIVCQAICWIQTKISSQSTTSNGLKEINWWIIKLAVIKTVYHMMDKINLNILTLLTILTMLTAIIKLLKFSTWEVPDYQILTIMIQEAISYPRTWRLPKFKFKCNKKSQAMNTAILAKLIKETTLVWGIVNITYRVSVTTSLKTTITNW